MNYLAHAYLSFGRPGILAGNMISDYVKGKKKYDYPDQIQQGIAVHREIDFLQIRIRQQKRQRDLSACLQTLCWSLMDVIYDHFLALDENEFTMKVYKYLRSIPMLCLISSPIIFRKNSAECTLI
jgi:acyl carrier protein phosphodiesterase